MTATGIRIKPRRFGSWYVAEHRVRAMRAYRQTLIATSIGNPLIYLFALGVGLAALVDRNTGDVGGVGYLTFVAPALLASAAVTVASEESTYPFLLGFKWNPIFFAMNAAPISGPQIANGMFIGMLARMIPTTAIYFVVMLLFGAVPSGWGALAIVAAVGAGIAVACVISAYTSRIVEDKGQMAVIQRFGVLPMVLFSGTFFPLDQLPIYIQWVGWISPLWHGTQLSRVATYGLNEPGWLIVTHVLYLAALTVVGWRMTQRVVTRRLDR
jgi:lipooligosaccharide transport system permease protein